jgi:hypothetical protein
MCKDVYLDAMKLTLTAGLIFSFLMCSAQEPQLQILKNGKIKKRISEGMVIKVVDHSNDVYIGPFYVINDTLIRVGKGIIGTSSIKQLAFLKKRVTQPFNWTRFGYTTLGVGLSVAGMTLSGWEDFPNALLYSAVLGYSSYIIGPLTKISLKKKKFTFKGNKRIRVWSLVDYD